MSTRSEEVSLLLLESGLGWEWVRIVTKHAAVMAW